MSLGPRLELRQSQSLVMTPRLQQALRMLRMSNLDLAGHVAGLVEANPLLSARLPERAAAPDRRGAAAFDGFDLLERVRAPLSLRDHLRAQVRPVRAEAQVVAAAMCIIDELEDDGFLRVPLEEIAARHPVTQAAAASGLALLQECEPAGVGARSLAECFRLQLADRGLLDDGMTQLLAHLDLLAEGRRAELAARCGVEPEALEARLCVLRRLDPRPGTSFEASPEELSPAIPDVFVRRTATGWVVEVNTETLPRVLVDNVYAAELSSAGREVRRYISECRMHAVWLVRSLEQRARTILAVASALVTHQEHFFAIGIAGLKPLSQRALAEKLGLHESTISRVTANKYLACARGTLPLRYFFSQSVGTRQGEAVSAAMVQDRIRALISTERAPHTLSDDRIMAMLQGEGIDIARRTVAKYREGMGIPSSVERRRLKAHV